VAASLVAILHRDAIRRLVDDRTFERGQAYAAQGHVVDLARQDRSLVAKVRGAEEYRVEIRVKGDAIAYSCTCPVGVEGAFCKHAVAVVLAWIGSVAPESLPSTPPPPSPPPRADLDTVVAKLSALPRERLLALLLDEAATDVALCQRIARRLRDG